MTGDKWVLGSNKTSGYKMSTCKVSVGKSGTRSAPRVDQQDPWIPECKLITMTLRRPLMSCYSPKTFLLQLMTDDTLDIFVLYVIVLNKTKITIRCKCAAAWLIYTLLTGRDHSCPCAGCFSHLGQTDRDPVTLNIHDLMLMNEVN